MGSSIYEAEAELVCYCCNGSPKWTLNMQTIWLMSIGWSVSRQYHRLWSCWNVCNQTMHCKTSWSLNLLRALQIGLCVQLHFVAYISSVIIHILHANNRFNPIFACQGRCGLLLIFAYRKCKYAHKREYFVQCILSHIYAWTMQCSCYLAYNDIHTISI